MVSVIGMLYFNKKKCESTEKDSQKKYRGTFLSENGSYVYVMKSQEVQK